MGLSWMLATNFKKNVHYQQNNDTIQQQFGNNKKYHLHNKVKIMNQLTISPDKNK